MTFRQVQLQKEYFIQFYITIENIRNIVHWNCCCQIYDGCPAMENFLNCDKRYSCYCQFVNRYNFDSLHKVKRNICLMKAFFDEILEDIKILKLYNHCASDYDFFIRLAILKN